MTKEDFQHWKGLQATQEIFKILKDTKQLFLEQMPVQVDDHIRLAKLAGTIEAFDYLINIRHEDMGVE